MLLEVRRPDMSLERIDTDDVCFDGFTAGASFYSEGRHVYRLAAGGPKRTVYFGELTDESVTVFAGFKADVLGLDGRYTAVS